MRRPHSKVCRMLSCDDSCRSFVYSYYFVGRGFRLAQSQRGMTLLIWLKLKKLRSKCETEHAFKDESPKMVALKQNKHKRLSIFIDVDKHFNFCPYIFTPQGVGAIELHANLGGGTVQIPNDEVPMNILPGL